MARENGPSFTNTASCRSAISFVDGERGILRYRGYPIEQLAERSNYLQTAYLLLDGFHHDAHRMMGVLVGAVGAGGSER